ncbi:MAG TPA: DUF4405 domain-containing protein [Rectinemataceae bacterium]|nr:DUF4405 domain-containing protein [Rectinemataceae bacterium]
MSLKNKPATNLFLDIAILLAFILAMTPRTTGIPLHEWMSIAFAFCVGIHLLLHWEWIVGVAPKFFANLFHESRLNFVVDLVFFLSLIFVIVSGLALSKVALPAIGITPAFSLFWRRGHAISADVALITLGVHCGFHAKWLAVNAKRYLIEPVARLFRKPSAAILPEVRR